VRNRSVEIHAQFIGLAQSIQLFEMFGLYLIAVNIFAAVIEIAGMQIQPMPSGNQT